MHSTKSNFTTWPFQPRLNLPQGKEGKSKDWSQQQGERIKVKRSNGGGWRRDTVVEKERIERARRESDAERFGRELLFWD